MILYFCLPTCHGLQKLITACEQYGRLWDLKYNSLKSQVATFGSKCPTNPIIIGMYIINTFIHNEQVQYKIVPNNLVKMENIWIEVTKNNTKYIIGGIYRHPNTSIIEYTKALTKSRTNSAHV